VQFDVTKGPKPLQAENIQAIASRSSFEISTSFLIVRFQQNQRESLVTNVFVGNLDITVTDQQLRELFAPHGTVETITIVKDRDTGEPRGMAFVEMTHASEAQSAISAVGGTMLNGRPMTVNEARPKIQPDPARDSGSRDHRRHRT
jgi:RNA recognition motif-containing protein